MLPPAADSVTVGGTEVISGADGYVNFERAELGSYTAAKVDGTLKVGHAPEPATATLSLLALAAPATRRRRK